MHISSELSIEITNQKLRPAGRCQQVQDTSPAHAARATAQSAHARCEWEACSTLMMRTIDSNLLGACHLEADIEFCVNSKTHQLVVRL